MVPISRAQVLLRGPFGRQGGAGTFLFPLSPDRPAGTTPHPVGLFPPLSLGITAEPQRPVRPRRRVTAGVAAEDEVQKARYRRENIDLIE